MNKTKKIGIVGAGPAGLSAAYFLRNKGYENITLLEKESEAGGKCNTLIVKNNPYEMGAIYCSSKSKSLLSIQKSLQNVPIISDLLPNFTLVDLETDGNPYCSASKASWIAWLKFFWQALKYKRTVMLGYTDCNPEYHIPFQQWLQNKKINLGDILGMFFAAYGYGYLEEVPTLYPMQYFHKFSFSRRPGITWLNQTYNTGFQDFWKQVAKSFSIIFNTEMNAIERSNTVRVFSNQGDFNFDYLIYACPLDELLKFEGTNAEEKAIFSRIYYYDYHTVCADFEGLSNITQLFAINRYLSNSAAKFQCLFRPWLDTNVAVAYVLGNRSLGMQDCLSSSSVIESIKEDLKKIGINMRDVHAHKKWKYFPHFNQTTLDEGIYRQLSALQGVNNTFYTGELLNFSTNENVIRYSKHLIEKFF